MSDLLDRLVARGWRLTAQRRLVADALRGANLHLTADEVHERARVRMPDISRATVYNTLNELVAMGEVSVVASEGRSNRYDANAAQPHQHLLCTECGELQDVQVDNLEELRILDGPASFEVRHVDLVFRGRCERCRGGRDAESHPVA